MDKTTYAKVQVNLPNYYDKSMDRAEVDKMLVRSIILLNEKGYSTRFCCAGHTSIDPSSEEFVRLDVDDRGDVIREANMYIKRHGAVGYITFARDIPFDFDLPEHWYYDDTPVVNCGVTIRFILRHPTYRRLKRLHSRFYDFVKKLPSVSDN